jgi:hypothetical protein
MTVKKLIDVLSKLPEDELVFLEHEDSHEPGTYIMEYVLGARHEHDMVVLFGG